MKIIAQIKPVALARTRITNRGRFLPKTSAQFRRDLAAIASEAMKGYDIFDKPIRVTVHFYKNLKPDSRNYGDIDNHVKAVLDALNGVVWSDDALIVRLHAFKHKGNPRIEIEVDFYDVH